MSPGGYKGRKKCRVKGEFSLAEPRVGIQLENYLGNIKLFWRTDWLEVSTVMLATSCQESSFSLGLGNE